jgi:hypothetical protein
MLFFHGNGGNISHRIEKIRLLCYPEISSLMIDYHGYGLSQGQPSEASCFTHNIYELLTVLLDLFGSPFESK